MSLSVFDFQNVASIHRAIQTVKGNKKIFRNNFLRIRFFSENENQYLHEAEKM